MEKKPSADNGIQCTGSATVNAATRFLKHAHIAWARAPLSVLWVLFHRKELADESNESLHPTKLTCYMVRIINSRRRYFEGCNI